MRATFNTFYASRAPAVLGLCGTVNKQRLKDLVNEAQQRLIVKGEFWGTYQRIRLQATAVDQGGAENGVIVSMPSTVASVASFAVDSVPIKSRSEFFEFLELGWGIRDKATGDLQAFDAGQSPIYYDFTGPKLLRLYVDDSEDEDLEVYVQGTDENDDEVISSDGLVADGEAVVLEDPYVETSSTWNSITGIIKPVTVGCVRLYEVDPTSGTQYLLGVYRPNETHPSFRRYLIPGIQDETVTAMVKLDFVPVVKDDDWLLIQNVPALKLMCQAIQKEEASLHDEAAVLEVKAISLLEDELTHYLGPGQQKHLSFDSTLWGVGDIPAIQ